MPSQAAHLPIDIINLIALFMAIWHTVRRLDVAKRTVGDSPHVAMADFARWQRAALRAHAIVLWSCFVYIAADLGFKAYAFPPESRFEPGVMFAVGWSLFLACATGVGLGLHQVRRSEKLRRALRIGSDTQAEEPSS